MGCLTSIAPADLLVLHSLVVHNFTMYICCPTDFCDLCCNVYCSYLMLSLCFVVSQKGPNISMHHLASDKRRFVWELHMSFTAVCLRLIVSLITYRDMCSSDRACLGC